MRTEKEVLNLEKGKNLSKEERALLKWFKGTCEKCYGYGVIEARGGCPQCGEVEMCNCNGSIHPAGMGCN